MIRTHFFDNMLCKMGSLVGLPVRLLLVTVPTILCAFPVNSVAAQTRFEEPKRVVDVTTYSTVYLCMALKNRLADRWQQQDTILWDTMPPGVSNRMVPWPRHIVAAVAQCTEQWSASTASLQDWDMLGELFLFTDRKADFSRLLMRKIAEVESNRKDDTTTGIDSAMSTLAMYRAGIILYANARPVHLREIDSLVTYMVALPDSIVSKESKISMLWGLRRLADEIGTEPLMAKRAAVKAEALFTGLSDAERRTAWYTGRVVNAAGKAKENSLFLHLQERLDSLQIGITAYVNLVRAQHNGIFKGMDPTSDMRFEIGAASPRIEGDFWFPNTPSAPRPTVGKRSLVVPLHACRGDWPSERSRMALAECLGQFATLKRVHRQFPDVEITLVTYQEGRAILQEPGSAADEAEDMRRWLLEYFQLPVTLVVNKANFVKLSDPDSRWVNTRWTLESMLNWGCTDSPRCGGVAYLVGETGVFLGGFGLRGHGGERRLVSLLEAIARRTP